MKPCTRCNGSGTEPDAVTEAARELAATIHSADISEGTRGILCRAATDFEGAAFKAISEREALLDEILGRFGMAPAPAAGDDGHSPFATHWMVQVPVADIQSWRERRQA